MKFVASTLAVAASMAALPVTDAFFRISCGGPLLRERADPIVNPGAVSAHLHNIVGSNGFGFTMTYPKSIAATCTTCMVTQDKSNYWIPDLFVQARNGSFHNVKNSGALIYYLQRRESASENLIAFPEGFRMLAGDPMRRSLAGAGIEQKGISYVCLGGATGETRTIPDSKCPAGLRVQIVMPSCWDGKNLDSLDHKSHVAYPDKNDNGKCPSTHPKRFITLFYEFVYDIAAWDSEWVNGKHPFVLSNGDRGGLSLHGDFVSGWKPAVLQKAIDECNNPSGRVEDCPVLQLQENKLMDDCMVAPSINEQTEGWLPKLPGCNPIQLGPGRAIQPPNCGATTTIGPKRTYSTDVSSRGWSYAGCAFDDLAARTLPHRYAKDDMTVQKCVDYCAGKGYSFAGLEYSVECFCGNSVAPNRLTAKKCTMKCGGDSTQYCGGPQKLSVYKKK